MNFSDYVVIVCITMENERSEDIKFHYSFKAAEVFKERITFYGYKQLNFFGTVKERMAIEKEAIKNVQVFYFKDIEKITYKRVFSTAIATIHYLDPKAKKKKVKYKVKGRRAGTNLGSVLLNLAVDTANTGIGLYHARNPKKEDK